MTRRLRCLPQRDGFATADFDKLSLTAVEIVKVMLVSINFFRHFDQSFLRKLHVFIIFTIFYTTGYGQVIRGSILEKGTEISIPNAAIYFSGTFAGTTSDENGDFEIDITKNASRPLTFSAIGYYSLAINNLSKVGPNIVYLIPKAYDLEEVIITAKLLKKERKANLKLFIKEFIGTTTNARKCEILNEDDISFNYGSDRDTLKAYALKPILIFNKALGYKITYYLDIFEYTRKSKGMAFDGSIIFTEDLSTPRTKQFYKRKRNKVYQGSRMHFFRTLWSNDLKSTKFMVKDSLEAQLEYNQIVIQDDNENTFLSYHENLYVYFLDAFYYPRLSKLQFLKDQVLFDKFGFFDPPGINWSGEMGKQRIADWLPYEYLAE